MSKVMHIGMIIILLFAYFLGLRRGLLMERQIKSITPRQDAIFLVYAKDLSRLEFDDLEKQLNVIHPQALVINSRWDPEARNYKIRKEVFSVFSGDTSIIWNEPHAD